MAPVVIPPLAPTLSKELVFQERIRQRYCPCQYLLMDQANSDPML